MKHSSRQSGFTLLEMIVALAIFSLLSLMAYQVLQSVLLNDAVTQKKSNRLSQIQKALYILQQDFSSAIVLERNENNANEPAFFAQQYGIKSDDWSAMFVRNSWLNPNGLLPRSELEKLGYRLKDGTLQRLSYTYPEPALGTEFDQLNLLDDVAEFKLRFYFNSSWHDRWQNSGTLPEAVEVSLKLNDYGMIVGRFMLTSAELIVDESE